MQHIKISVFLLLTFLITVKAQCQQDSIRKEKLKAVIITDFVAYSGSMTGLYNLWYKDYAVSKFHLFNDNNEWLLMDKSGHFMTAYYLSKVSYDINRWARIDKKKAVLFGSGLSFIYLSTIEVFDGFSTGWGFSLGDMIANTSGIGLFTIQQILWDKQKLKLKWSFHKTKYPSYRPDLLGNTFSERTLKDYNGQTYWLSGNIASLFNTGYGFPKWLNIAIGYGADGMLGGNNNPVNLPYFKRQSQFYIAPDIDLSEIKTGNENIDLLLKILNFIKIPLPAAEFNSSGKSSLYWLYF
ncbi:MAG: DUF2279 domain-containing protein [Bacteroidales bacterium]|nr:DUF2279 domain-containing protein [Bacteroidales bacterium]